ncbi:MULTISPECIES: hypothetical protein [Bacillota]|uniref:ABC transporter permease n=2 Tax=Erysipelotrichaceae TaxID=128827 RepID=A0ABS9R900_9FIRM|nr:MULTISPECIES: hypothetical protein [Bacillota]MCH4286127.1 ABC transporter permease [Amedibacillus hominis]RGB53366.1 hypothetical protein DW271_12360 [Absiella sp. AM22-9]RGB59179.1 hypothetical protein DW120_12415 [Absiella sp. AM10-20]RGB67433.1 hypothetical protein DW113_06605 [Absiella sp. AM09-45]RGB76882.1 hypothetical protein DW114_07380 [Absiella sp. AM09-50]
MWKLIYYEMKKLISSFSGKLILLLFLGICIWQTQQDIKSVFNDDWNGMEVSQLIEKQKSLEGNYQDIYKKIPDLEKDAMHYNPNREIDEEMTNNMNSFDWKKIYKAYENHTLTLEMVNDLIDIKFHSLDEVVIHYGYKDDLLWSNLIRYIPDQDIMLNRNNYIYQPGNNSCLLGECDNVKDEVSKKEINRRFLNLSNTYQSNYIENNIVDRINYTNMVILIVIAVLFANIFSREAQGKTDTYLACSPITAKTVGAKIIFALLLGAGIPLLCKIVTFVYAILQSSGIHWDMFFYQQENLIASYVFSIKELVSIGFINQLLMTISLCISILFISQKSKNTYFSAILSLIFVIFPIYYAVFHMGGYEIASYFPSNLLMYFSEHLNVVNYTSGVTPLFMSVAGLIIPAATKYWIIWIILDIILVLWMFREGKLHRVLHA